MSARIGEGPETQVRDQREFAGTRPSFRAEAPRTTHAPDARNPATTTLDRVTQTRGVLFPQRLPEFHRLPPPERVADLVTWFWIPEWSLDPGETSRQHVVAYPALNLVVEASGVEIVGASTAASYRDLTGRGWAVGALLRPAAVAALVDDPAHLVDRSEQLDLPELHDTVVRAMSDDPGGPAEGRRPSVDRPPVVTGRPVRPSPTTFGTDGSERRDRAVAVFADWLASTVGEATDAGRHANTMAEVLMASDVRTPEQAATRLAVSVRTLQRMAHRHVGLSPAAMIRRRRLQEAAERVRAGESDLARLAADLGYADHAHLTTDFRTVLGFTPSAYRAATSS